MNSVMINFINGKYLFFESENIDLDTIGQFLRDYNSDSTLTIDFDYQIGGDLGDLYSTLINDGKTVYIVRDEVVNIVIK